MAWGAGRFGFQKEMNALQSLSTGNEEEAYNTTALLKSTHEVEERIQEVYRCPTLSPHQRLLWQPPRRKQHRVG